MAYEPAADRGAGPGDAAPTVHVHVLAITQRLVDGVEDAGCLLWTARHAHINDGMPLMHELRAEPAGLPRRGFTFGASIV